MSDMPTREGWDDARWVLIESGSNQDYIFRSPKRRYNVGASALLIEVGEWAKIAAKTVGDAEAVVVTSSKALLKVKSVEAGRAIIRKVTQSALTLAPGLDVWGVIEGEGHSGDELGERIARLHDDHRDARYRRPTPHRRSMMLPFLQSCAVTGLAASSVECTGDKDERAPVSDQASTILGRAQRRHDDLSGWWHGHTLEMLTEELSDDGWVAIVHADGNRVGALMTAINDEATMKSVSDALVASTKKALDMAIAEVGGTSPEAPWILPLIIGGDDVTAIVNGKQALKFADSYLRHFEAATASDPALAQLARAATGHPWVTAAAGVLACHAKTPFSLAYHLVEKVTDVAKEVRDLAPGRSAFSFFCAGDSVPSSVEDDRLPRIAGNSVFGRSQQFVVAGHDGTESQWTTAHAASALLDAVDVLLSEEPPISRGSVSDVRMQLGAGELRQSTINRLNAASESTRRFVEAHLTVDDGLERKVNVGTPEEETITTFTRWLDLNDALSLARGKVEAPSAKAALS